jgi:CheY-like chemotaxis protein
MQSVLMPVACAALLDSDLWSEGDERHPSPSFDSDDTPETAVSRILIVDDEASVRRMLRRLLSECGYQVVEAEDGAEALAIVTGGESPFDLVITDIKMPVMDGRELGRKLHAAVPKLPVLYVSAYSSDMTAGVSAGRPSPFLRKPFEPEGLLRTVATLLRNKAP